VNADSGRYLAYILKDRNGQRLYRAVWEGGQYKNMDKRAENLLIVDDNELLAISMQHHLEKVYPHVATAANGNRALDELRRTSFGKVLLDIDLPDINGLDLLTVIKQRYPFTAVIMMTANDFEEVRAEAYKRGASGYVGKPFSVAALQGLIDNTSV
jgi:UDP-3-O-[3-hydroxymyristoyl] N-acetylglucosamine deacetylase